MDYFKKQQLRELAILNGTLRCQASCTSQRNQKSELMERARQITYTLQHPHSRVTGEEKANTWTQTGEEKVNT
jgi:hypothetical protein